MLGFVFGFFVDIFIDRSVDRTAEHMSRHANDEDRVLGAYKDAWVTGKTSGRSIEVLVEQLQRWNVPADLADETAVVGASLREWFNEGIPPRTVKRLLRDVPLREA